MNRKGQVRQFCDRLLLALNSDDWTAPPGRPTTLDEKAADERAPAVHDPKRQFWVGDDDWGHELEVVGFSLARRPNPDGSERRVERPVLILHTADYCDRALHGAATLASCLALLRRPYGIARGETIYVCPVTGPGPWPGSVSSALVESSPHFGQEFAQREEEEP